MTHAHHTFDYVELAVDDLTVARAFYGSVFDWQFNDYGPSYAGIRSADGDGEVGGLNATGGPGSVGGPLVLLWSDDLDATAAAVAVSGGTVTEGPYEFPGGRRFHFTDPAGNGLGVWSTA